MRSWPARLLSPSSKSSSPASTTPGGRSGPSSHSRSRSHNPPSTSLSISSLARSPRWAIGGRRSEGDLSSAAKRDTEKELSPPTNKSTTSSEGSSSKMTGNGASAELKTGNCMCCDSTVRWPSNLAVFRCTICMTINDLKLEVQTSPSTQASASYSVSPISVEVSRDIIDSCIDEFLHTRRLIRQMPTYPPPPPPIPSVDDNDNSQERKIYSTSSCALQCSLIFPNNGTVPALALPTLPPRSSEMAAEEISQQLSSRGNLETETLAAPPSRTPPRPPGPIPGIKADRGNGDKISRERGSLIPDSQDKDIPRDLTERIFKPLEDYLVKAFSNLDCLNQSFLLCTSTEAYTGRQEEKLWHMKKARNTEIPVTSKIGEKETMMLMSRVRPVLKESTTHKMDKERDSRSNLRSPGIDWDAVSNFYNMIITAGDGISRNRTCNSIRLEDEMRDGITLSSEQERLDQQREDREVAENIKQAKNYICSVLLKATENLLKRPGKLLKKPSDIRFLLIILANPLLHPTSPHRSRSKFLPKGSKLNSTEQDFPDGTAAPSRSERYLHPSVDERAPTAGGLGQHSGIIKRVLGLLSNLPNESHHYLVTWFSRMPEYQFRQLVELGCSFVTYRLTRQQGRKPGARGKMLIYNNDWQIRATARVVSLLFSANNNSTGRRNEIYPPNIPLSGDGSGNYSSGLASRDEARRRGQIIPTSDFYNMLLDYHDMIADFDSWELRTSKFCFCQYPFFLSMGAKISILEHDAKRQMERKAHQAFFSSLASRRAVNQYLVLKVRRECLVEDSLKGISEGVGGVDDIKKGLRIEFVGEDGIDAGGLKKEWFLLVVRDVFDPNYGMFVYDDDSHYCYFNPNSLESSEEFFLVGVLLGLAIYNSTILDVALPPYVFKKLIYSNSPHNLPTSATRPPLRQTLEDLAVFRPVLAKGLLQLLEFDGDVQETFCRDFVAETERFGQIIHVPLCPNGENKPVTNGNRKDFVDLYVKYLLDTSVSKQFEPFKRGFYTVCGGNALSLFRPEEIELLVRGSDEPLDVSALKAVAIYDGWGTATPADNDPVVKWFWGFFERINPKEQRILLRFITGSDRIPAMGATNLTIKIVCLGQDCNRFPVARTCFNQICLWRYKRREKLERLLWTAVTESEGFGLK